MRALHAVGLSLENLFSFLQIADAVFDALAQDKRVQRFCNTDGKRKQDLPMGREVELGGRGMRRALGQGRLRRWRGEYTTGAGSGDTVRQRRHTRD